MFPFLGFPEYDKDVHKDTNCQKKDINSMMQICREFYDEVKFRNIAWPGKGSGSII
jgi:hypothetical protein